MQMLNELIILPLYFSWLCGADADAKWVNYSSSLFQLAMWSRCRCQHGIELIAKWTGPSLFQLSFCFRWGGREPGCPCPSPHAHGLYILNLYKIYNKLIYYIYTLNINLCNWWLSVLGVLVLVLLVLLVLVLLALVLLALVLLALVLLVLVVLLLVPGKLTNGSFQGHQHAPGKLTNGSFQGHQHAHGKLIKGFFVFGTMNLGPVIQYNEFGTRYSEPGIRHQYSGNRNLGPVFRNQEFETMNSGPGICNH